MILFKTAQLTLHSVTSEMLDALHVIMSDYEVVRCTRQSASRWGRWPTRTYTRARPGTP